jgi:hypothetical protein
MATQDYKIYNIDVFWDDSYESLDYIHEQFNDTVSLDQWRRLGYSERITGMMCDMRSAQPVWNDRFVKMFADQGWQDIGTSYYRMDTGTVLPTHSDLYKKYIDIFDLYGQENTIRRAVVFLRDWRPGHYAELAGKGIVNWSAGMTLEWSYDTPHAAANIGVEPRYTLQITGHI